MFRHLGHHMVKKYNHTLIIDPIYEEKPNRSQVYTSTSSGKNIDNPEKTSKQPMLPNKIKYRNRQFSPQLSLKKYRQKNQVQTNQPNPTQLILKPKNKQVKLIISTLYQNKIMIKRYHTPTKQNDKYKLNNFCLHCLNHQKNRNHKFIVGGCSLTNVGTPPSQRIQEFNNFQDVKLDQLKSDKILWNGKIDGLRSSNRTYKSKKQDIKRSIQFKPWDISNSDISV